MQVTHDELRSMSLHENKRINNMVITRVINGWIYRFEEMEEGYNGNGVVEVRIVSSAPCFVPL